MFLLGGQGYCTIEILWRGRTHYSMFLAGGIILMFLAFIQREMKKAPLLAKCLLGTVFITAVEFIFGCIFNITLGMNVWNYENVPLNLLGQICLPFTVLWFFISAPAIVLDDYLRYWFFGEEKPHYIIKIGGKPNADHRSRIS